MTETIRTGAATDLVRAAFMAAGAREGQAGPAAAALVLAEASGQTGHGLVRVPTYAACVAAGKIDGRAQPAQRRISDTAWAVDAGGGFAAPAWAAAREVLHDRIMRDQTVGAVTVTHSNHLGVVGHVAEALCADRYVAFVFGNATACMAPWGSARPLFGTNPIAFAAPGPAGAPPLVIDMATSAVTKGSILARKAAGETTVPEGWATDRDGTPTTDIDEAIAGNVAPMGGAKGAALAMMVEVMAACVGGGALSARCSTLLDAEGPPPDLAATALVLDPAALSGGLYPQQITALMAEFDACAGARLPGARRHEARAAAERDGLTVPAALLDRIRAIAEGAPAEG